MYTTCLSSGVAFPLVPQGVVSEPSEKFELKPVPGLKAQWESMKYVVLILFVCMFPIFAAGWPAPSRLRWFWVVLAAGVLGGGGYFTWVMYLKVPVEVLRVLPTNPHRPLDQGGP